MYPVLRGCISLNELQGIALSGVTLSYLSHLCSVYVLYFLAKGLYIKSDHGKQVALCAALLHTLSPAGVFLIAPYTESLFSFLNITGFALYLQGMNRMSGHATPSQRLRVIIAGLVFGFATTIRSNGLLSGLPFLYDAVARSWAIAIHGFSKRRLYDLGALIIGGMLVLSGLLLPQILAYRAYCIDSVAGARQPWCTRSLPSIYAWVQEHYWYVMINFTGASANRSRVNGFLRYWTISNMPLFLLAAPMLIILSYTAFQVLWPDAGSKNRTSTGKEMGRKTTALDEGGFVRLAIPQLVLAVLAFFVYNVQIITRLSSGYPLWYICLAEHIVLYSELGTEEKSFLRSNYVFRFMVMYAVIQGGLFASFLPPA